ncbi:hypothetical protein EEW87_17560 (plasmid) [Janibacter melonis]|uniref:Uncharacterized protein n=1 Tax=Janibacter melonis TaxID=262209 RepID=A0A650GFV8_9MICO|nr:hypothetical protein [Janibacter melonis]QGX08812.1 hypothetical protein EEW87_17560 [Janibacter melonis]
MTIPTAIGDNGETREEFDPRSVPAFPIVNVRLYRTEDGAVTGEVDGADVDVDPDAPIDSVMRHAQDAAATRPMRAVRVTATDVDGKTWPMVVHADGRTWDLDTTPEPERTGMRRSVVAAIAAGTLVLAGAGLGGAWYIAAHQDPPTATAPVAAPAGEAPVVPVAGWARRAAWVSPAINVPSDGAPLLVTDSTVVATLDDGPSAQLAALRPDDGATLWTVPIDNRVTGSPQQVAYQGREGIAVATGDALTIWPNSTTEPNPTTWEISEPGLTLVPTSKIPLLASTETLTALVLQGDALQQRVLPAGAQPLVATDDAAVLAADDSGRWWTLTSEQTAPSPETLTAPSPKATPLGIVGVAGRTLVYAWQDRGQTALTGYATESSMEPAWSVVISEDVDADDFAASPDGSWAIAGTTAIESETGTIRALPEDWSTAQITDEAAWSTAGDGYRAERMKPAQRIPGGADVDPQGIPVATAGDRGLIIASTGQAQRIYALEPDTGTAYGPDVTPSAADGESK